eukprot:SAG11_NODE_5335_length_1592_cov_5.702612_3_plen_46_part_01
MDLKMINAWRVDRKIGAMLIAFKFPKPPPYTDATAGAGATEDPVVP